MRIPVLTPLWRHGARRLAVSLMLAAALSLALHAVAPVAAALADAPCHGPAVAHEHASHGHASHDHAAHHQHAAHHDHGAGDDRADPAGLAVPPDDLAGDGAAHANDAACCSISCAFAIGAGDRAPEGRTPIALSLLPASSPAEDGQSPDGLKRPPRTACIA